ncbi:MAG: HD domain-containing protein [Sedimentisphaerales bacterium]|nr:HD domain-containing protein [Sedimentisphaerales bacterium]
MSSNPQNPNINHDLEALTCSLTQTYEELALLHRISEGMRVTQKPEGFFQDYAEHILEVLDSEKLLIFWQDQTGYDLELPRVTSAGRLSLDRVHLEVIWDRSRQSFIETRGILIDSSVDGSLKYQWPEHIRNIVSVPIRRNRHLMGALVAINKIKKPDFDSIDTKMLVGISNEFAVFLENSRLYRDLEELLVGALRALSSSIDAKDPYTCGHSERVAMICRHIAEQLSLSPIEVNHIYLSGLLHDVGKIGINELVLCKPGRLTVEEFDQIKKHPQIGADILRPIRQMEEVARSVLAHHERYDGSGYPLGLAGRDIPLAGRVVMLADSFDSMFTDRTYRRALPVEVALADIRRFSGTQFDPQLTDAFLSTDLSILLMQLEDNTVHTHPHYIQNHLIFSDESILN